MIGELREILKLSPLGPLNNILVIEIGGYISAPMAAQILLSEGATVLKIEPRGVGDPSRKALSKPMFTSLNAGKASIVLDLLDNLYLKILKMADVIIDNRSPKARERDKFLQEFLRSPNKYHPAIYCTIVGYDSNENKDRLAFDVSVQAETGMAWSNAFTPEQPLKVGFFILDITAGMQAASVIKTAMIGLFRQYKSSKQDNDIVYCEVSMAKISALFQMGQYLNYIDIGQEKIRFKNQDLFLCPFSFYKANDNVLLSIGVVSDEQFARLCNDVLLQNDLVRQYPTNKIRVENSEFIEKIISELILEKNSDHWVKLCKKCNIACSKVNKISDVFKQPFASKFINHTITNVPIISVNSDLNDSVTCIFNDAPELDQHKIIIEKFVNCCLEKNINSFESFCESLNNNKFEKTMSFDFLEAKLENAEIF